MALPDLNDLALLLRVSETGSFSAAARSLHLAPKTVSQRIARLEHHLACTLFERNTRHLKMTDEAQAIIVQARLAIEAGEAIQALASHGSSELQGTIRLSAPAPFGRKYVASAISDFCRLHPQIGFELRLSDRIVDLLSGDLDLAIRIGELADSRLLARRIAHNCRLLVASPSYLHQHGYPQHPQDLSQHQILLFNYPGLNQDHWVLQQAEHVYPVTPQGRLCSDNGEVLREWCLAGLGIAMREVWDIHQELHNGTLEPVLTQWSIATTPISLVRAHRQPVPRRLSAFSDFLVERWREAEWAK